MPLPPTAGASPDFTRLVRCPVSQQALGFWRCGFEAFGVVGGMQPAPNAIRPLRREPVSLPGPPFSDTFPHHSLGRNCIYYFFLFIYIPVS